MNAAAILAALDLPEGSRVDRRIPKKLLLELGAITSADRRQINDGIEDLVWIAALKPTTVGIPAYHDGAREYLEVAVLRLTLKAGARMTRLVELVHRAVPYPVFLLCESGSQPNLSAAHKRWALNEAGKAILDGSVIAVDVEPVGDAPFWPAFAAALALGRQPRRTLHTLYQGWIDTLLALGAARVTGAFSVAGTDRAADRQEALEEYSRLDAEIRRLRSAASREKQLARQVELNMEVKRIEAARVSMRQRL
jgi:hypothetical protein